MGSLLNPFNAWPAGRAAGAGLGMVVVHAGNMERRLCHHESVTHRALAQRLAHIKGFEFGGEFDPSSAYPGTLYFVPSDTFVTLDAAHRLGVRGEQDLFGGVVPFPFIATKTITHPLCDAEAQAPEGWSWELARRLQDVVLPGFSAFSIEDARKAGGSLLERGAVRLKLASGIGGLGQWVATDEDELDACLQDLDAEEVARCGMVLEQNLADVATLSVGQVRVDDMLATYCGTQQLAVNNAGEEVYGGSRLIVARGGFDALLELELGPEMLTAIAQARHYHATVMQSFPGMFASRCNYDVAQGFDEGGRRYSGVLEQSWRIGGASAAEVAAFGAFRADPSLDAVCALTREIYGEDCTVPDDADVYFRGTDDRVGPITKYARLESYADA